MLETWKHSTSRSKRKCSSSTPSQPRSINNPLHIAALLGHAEFARVVLRLKPRLARDLNGQGFTPLHLACASGNQAVVRELLVISSGSDLCRLRDKDGLMPIHTAAANWRVNVLPELLKGSPELAEELTCGGDTVLHCAVKSGCSEGVEFLVERMCKDGVLSLVLNSKDDKGNTILHLAVARRQLQTIKMLLTKSDMKVNMENMRGLTVLDMLLESPTQYGDMEIAGLIVAAGGKNTSEGRPQQGILY